MHHLKLCKYCNPINVLHKDSVYWTFVNTVYPILVNVGWYVFSTQEPPFLESTAEDGTVQRQEGVWCATVVERQSNRMCTASGYPGCYALSEKEWYVDLLIKKLIFKSYYIKGLIQKEYSAKQHIAHEYQC